MIFLQMYACTHDSYDIRMFTFKNEQSKVVWQPYAAFTISMQQTYRCRSRVRIFFMILTNNFEPDSATFSILQTLSGVPSTCYGHETC